MKTLSHRLLESFQGGLLSLVLLRVILALSASPAPDIASARTISAGILPQFFHDDFFVTPDQMKLLLLMCVIVALVGCAWGLATTLDENPGRRSA